MSAAPTPIEPTPIEPAPIAGPADRDHAHLAATVQALIDAGAKLVQDLLAEPAPASAKAEPYERLARAVRRSVLLARHLAENPVRTQAARRTTARKQIIRAVEDTIGREAPGHRAETLRQELRERLDAPDLDDDIANRPIEDVIDEIRRDLGLGNIPGLRPFPRRTPAALQALAALAAAPTGAAAALPSGGPAAAAPDLPPPGPGGGAPDAPALPPGLRVTLLAKPPRIRDD